MAFEKQRQRITEIVAEPLRPVITCAVMSLIVACIALATALVMGARNAS